MVGMMYTVCNGHPLVRVSMLFVDTSIIHHSSEGVLILCNILDLLIYSTQVNYTLYHAGCQFIFYKILTLSLLLLLDLYIFFLFSMYFYCKSANSIVTCCFASVTISSGNFMNFNSLIALPDVTAPGYSL